LVQGQVDTGAEPEGTPANNRCVNAVPTELDVPVSGTSELGIFDFVSQAACGIRSNLSAVWYSVTGTGGPLTVGLCTSNEMQIDFGILSLCNSQDCFGFPTESRFAECQNDEYATYTINTEDGVNYFVHVRGIKANFDILLKEGARTDENFLDDALFVRAVKPNDGAVNLALTGAFAAAAAVMFMVLI
jgi:hypothetical protein